MADKRKGSHASITFGRKRHAFPIATTKRWTTGNSNSAAVTVTEYKDLPGRSHYIIAETGWEEVADYALSWATSQANSR